MTAYRLQQYLFDQLGRWSSDPTDRLDLTSYELDPAELAAVQHNDIADLSRLGVHPVLLNAWCRATGHSRDDYRTLHGTAPPARPRETTAMADLCLRLCSSHAPMMVAAPESAPDLARRAWFEAMAELRARGKCAARGSPAPP